MFNLAERNLKIYFRQKSTVFFSLLSVFIIIGLYVVFLGNIWASDYELPGKDLLMQSWIIAGIMATASITTTMGAFGIMVEDRVKKNDKDFLSAPIKRSQLVGGYLMSSCVIGVMMSLFAFILGEAYIIYSGGKLLSLMAMVKLLAIILLSVTASSAFVFFIVSFFTNNSAYSTASTVLGTLVGFLTGIYLPIGTLPEAVQWIIKIFPVSHAAALMRQVLMESQIKESFADIPDTYITAFKNLVGVTYTYGTYTARPLLHVLVLCATAIIFFLLALWNVSRKK